MSGVRDSEKEIVIYIGTRKLMALEGVLGGGDPRISRFIQERRPEGFQNGLVVHLERAAHSLQSLMNTLMPQRGNREIPVHVVLGNAKLKSYHFSSSQYYQGQPRVVSAHDIRAIVNQTRSVATLPLSEFVLQAIPESFTVNDLEEIRNPLGLEAQRLCVRLNIFTMNFQDFKNISRALEACDLSVQGYFPKTLTLSEAVLSEQEKEEGALIVDIADEVTHLIAWKNGALVETAVTDYGSKFLTRLIADTWKIESHDAERIKEHYATLSPDSKFEEELIPMVIRNGRESNLIQRRVFHDRFLSQSHEWLSKVLESADKLAAQNGLSQPHYIFTGGGTNLDGFLEFLHRDFSRPARLGLSRRVEAAQEALVDPSMASAMGMFRWLAANAVEQERLLSPHGLIEKTIASARNWFFSYF
jgi:cell division protein FtsA